MLDQNKSKYINFLILFLSESKFRSLFSFSVSWCLRHYISWARCKRFDTNCEKPSKVRLQELPSLITKMFYFIIMSRESFCLFKLDILMSKVLINHNKFTDKQEIMDLLWTDFSPDCLLKTDIFPNCHFL